MTTEGGSQAAETLRCHAESGVELAREVLKGDERRQLDDRLAIKVRTEALEVPRFRLSVRIGDRLGVGQCRTLPFAKPELISKSQCRKLIKIDTSLTPHGRIEIDTKGTPVDLRDAYHDQ